MLTEDYLNLRLVRLKSSQQWARAGEGVAFVFPCAGIGQYIKASGNLLLSSGDLLVSNIEGKGKICPANGGDFAFWAFWVRMEHLFPLFAGPEISLLQTVIGGFRNLKFYPRSSRLASECHKLLADIPPQFNLNHRGQLLRLAAVILNEEFKVAHGQRVGFIRAEDHLVQVFEKLSAEEMLGLSVPELADRFGCSRRHLNRLFHQYFGFSVAALRMEMRLLKAISLLRDRDAKVINVAEQCGFNHLGLFNTCFRRRFGTSPGQWRKAASEDRQNPAEHNGSEPDCPFRMRGLCPLPGNGTAGKSKPAQKTASRPGKPTTRKERCPKTGSIAAQLWPNLQITAAQKTNKSITLQVRAQS